MIHPTLHRIVNEDYQSFFLIAGPCVIESYDLCKEIAVALKTTCTELDIPLIFKASFKKANRTRLDSFATLGADKAIDILRKIKSDLGVAITTDIHEVQDIGPVKDVVDLIQIPAFLCRQTDLLISAGQSGLPVNIKKGQFATASTMAYAVEKVKHGQEMLKEDISETVFLTERGTMHGYHDLIVDARSISDMSAICTSIIDITHSNQRPNQGSGITEGRDGGALLNAKVGLVAGARGIFLEAHPSPKQALSDGATMIPLDEVDQLIKTCDELSRFIRSS